VIRPVHAPVAAAVLLAAACGGLAPRPGHPWLEDLSLALVREVLVMEVLDERVSVEARFRFEVHGKARDRVMFFPVAPPGGPATGFSALLGGPDETPLALPVRPALPGALPAGRALQTFDILVPGGDLERHGGKLVVRYEQEATCGFSYILASGAYWRGPIGELVVRLVDGGSRVDSATVEGQPPHLWRDGTATWSWKGIEPRSGVVLVLSCP
jgi:hypothetical protein